MTQELKFKIGSEFSGEGFKAAQVALRENGQAIRASVKGLGDLTDAFAKVSPGAADAVKGVRGFASAFVTGGIVGGTIQLAIQGISKAVEAGIDLWKKSKEAVKKYAEMMRDNLIAVFGDASAKFAEVKKNMEALTQQARDLNAALNISLSGKVQEEIYRVNVEKLQKITDDMTTAGRALVDAQAEQKIATIKATAAVESAGNALDAASVAYDNAAKVQKEAAMNAAKAEAALNIARNDSTLSHEDYTKALTAAQKAQDDLVAAERNLEKARQESEKAAYAHNKAVYDLEVATREHAQKIRDAEAAVEKERAAAAEANEKVAEAKRKEAAAIDDWHDELLKMKQNMEDEIERRKALGESTKKLTDAQNKAADETNGNGNGGDGNGGGGKIHKVNIVKGNVGVNVGVFNPVQEEIRKPKKLDNETWERFKNGLANAADMARIKRFQENDQRTAYNDLNRIKADAIKFVKIVDQPASWRSAADNALIETMKTKVFTQLPADVSKQLLGEAGKHVLTSEAMKDILGNNGALLKFLTNMSNKLGLK